MSEARRPTSHDVARRAGVSQTAVSLVLRGQADGRVSAKNQAAVRRAAEALGYGGNHAARSLRLGRPDLVGLMIPDVSDPFFASVLRGAQRSAAEAGFRVVMLEGSGAEDWRTQAEADIASGAVAGVVVCDPRTTGPSELEGLHAAIALVDSSPSPAIPSVRIPAAEGVSLAVSHLRALGHTRLARLALDVSSQTFRDRDGAFRSATRGWATTTVERCAGTLAAAEGAARTLLGQAGRPTAIVADTDLLAAGVYRAARALGLRVPRDLSVVGFNDTDLAMAVEPPLTTVHVPGETVGAQAVSLLLESILSRAAALADVPVHLVVRGSTAPPGAEAHP